MQHYFAAPDLFPALFRAGLLALGLCTLMVVAFS